MGILDSVKGISQLPQNKLDVIMGFPGSGKTTLAATYPKPLLYIQIGDDGGGIVMNDYSDNDIKQIVLENDQTTSLYMKLLSLLNELEASNGSGFKTVVLDAYSSIEETMIQAATATKGRPLNWDERGAITQAMINLRDRIVSLSKKTPTTYVEITHLKQTESTDNITGESSIRYIPKMSSNNGNIMLERANNVMYCARKVCSNPTDGKPEVKFLTYIGAHPNIDTKFRYKSEFLQENKGLYIEDCTYEKIQNLIHNKLEQKEIKIVESKEDSNPFKQENKEQW